MRFSTLYTTVLLAAGTLLLEIPLLGQSALARGNRASSTSARQGLPGRRISGGSRLPTACSANPTSLVALMPEDNLAQGDQSLTLWFYLPDMQPAQQLEFKLVDQANAVHSTTLVAPTAAGIAGVDLAALSKSDALPELVAGQPYRWSLAVVCNPADRSEDRWVQGWVEQVDVSDRPIEADFLWLDSLNRLLSHLHSTPQLTQTWLDLLETEGIDQLLPSQALPELLGSSPAILQPASSALTETAGVLVLPNPQLDLDRTE